jgi:drug/metabolite transporter (DMT)-like permease
MAAPGESPRSTSALLGVTTVILTLVGWSSVPLFLRHFADSIDAWTSNGWRYGFSALVWLPVLLAAAWMRTLPHGLFRAALVPSIVNALGQTCFAWAHYRIDPALLTFGLRTQLLFVAIGAYLLFPKERAIIRTRSYLLGAALLIAGVAGVMLLDGGSDTPSRHERALADSTSLPEGGGEGVGGTDRTDGDLHPLTSPPLQGGGGSDGSAPGADTAMRGTLRARVEGIALALASGLLFACYGLSVRKWMDGVNSVLAFAAICQYTAIVMVALMVVLGVRGGLTALDLAPDQFMWLLISALIGIAIGHVFYYFSIARLGVAVTAGVLQLQPFLVAVASLAIFGELLSLGQWTAGLVAVAGAMLMLSVQWRAGRAARRRTREEPIAAPIPPR